MLEVQINYRCQENSKRGNGTESPMLKKDLCTVGGADAAKRSRATMILQMTPLDLLPDPKIRQ